MQSSPFSSHSEELKSIEAQQEDALSDSSGCPDDLSQAKNAEENDMRNPCDIKTECDSDTSCYSASELLSLERAAETNQKEKTETVSCWFCPKMFKFANSRNRHMKIHHNDLLFVCEICKKIFIAESDFNEHLSLRHPNLCKNVPCGGDVSEMVSGQFSEGSTNLSESMTTKASECKQDDQVMKTVIHDEQINSKDIAGTAAKMLRRSPVSKIYRPKKLFFEKPNDSDQTQGLGLADIGSVDETDANLTFFGEKLNPIIKKIHEKQLKELNIVKTSTRKDIQKCDYCEETFRKKSERRKHERAVHMPTEFPCQFCGKVYRRLYDLKDHERTHTGHRPFKCDQCDKAFTSKHGLSNHQNIHASKGAFMCMYCGKDFDSKSGMQYHELAHTGARPQQCDVCSKTFKHRSALNTHMRIHTGEKPYACTYCSKSFRDSSTLRKHVRIHTLEKPYKCRECDKAYNQRWCLRTHYLKSHPNVTVPIINPKYPMLPSQSSDDQSPSKSMIQCFDSKLPNENSTHKLLPHGALTSFQIPTHLTNYYPMVP